MKPMAVASMFVVAALVSGVPGVIGVAVAIILVGPSLN